MIYRLTASGSVKECRTSDLRVDDIFYEQTGQNRGPWRQAVAPGGRRSVRSKDATALMREFVTLAKPSWGFVPRAEDDTAAVEAVEQQNPRSVLLALEQPESGTDRREIFGTVMIYIFSDGPHPAHVARRIFDLVAVVDRELLKGMHPALLRELRGMDDEARRGRLALLLRGTRCFRNAGQHERVIEATLATAHARLRAAPVWQPLTLDELVSMYGDETLGSYQERVATMAGLVRFLFLKGQDPREVVRRAYCLAKGVMPELVVNMTLEQIGELFGQLRATWSIRVKQTVNRFVRLCGYGRELKLRFQKSADACATYREVQRGNQNRRGGAAKVA